MKLNPDISPPQNESTQHFLLKCLAQTLLKYRFKCCYSCTEVTIGKYYDFELKEDWSKMSPDKRPPFRWGARKVTDACGIKLTNHYYKTKDTKKEVRSIEAKVSKTDLEHGYCIAGDYNYIIAPKGLFTPDEILNFVGLIEVDMDKLEWKDGFNKITGVTITSNPKRINQNRSQKNNWVKHLIDDMLRNYTNENAFRGKWFYPGYSEWSSK